MVEFSELSDVAQDNVNRILRGRPPNPDRGALNEAINFINENPSLRKVTEGGAPTGLSPERLQLYKQQLAFETIPGSPLPGSSSAIIGKTPTEQALQMSLLPEYRNLSVDQVKQIQEELAKRNQQLSISDVNFKQSLQAFPLNIVKREPQYDPTTGQSYFINPAGERIPFDPSTSISRYLAQRFNAFSEAVSPGIARATTPIINFFTPLGAPKVTVQQVENLLTSKVNNVKYSDIAKFAFFAPAFSTATTGEQEAEITYTSYGKKARDILAHFEKLFAEERTKEAGETLSKIIRSAPNEEAKANAIENVRKLLDALRERGLVGDYVIDQFSGQVLIGPTRVINLGEQVSAPAIIGRANLPLAGPVSAATEVGSNLFFSNPSEYAGTGQYEQQEFTSPTLRPEQRGFTNTIPLLTPTTLLGLTSAEAQRSEQLTQPNQQAQQLQQPQQNLFFTPSQRSQQQQATNQLFRQEQRTNQQTAQLFTPEQSLFFEQPQKLQQRQEQRLRFEDSFGFELPSGEKETTKFTKRRKAPQEIEGFIPQVKEKGKWINVFKKPLSEKQARALALDVVDQTTSAQMRLLPSKGRKVRLLDIPKVRTIKFRDYFLKNGKKIGLTNKGLIEKRSFRIDTLGEKRQLSVARYLSQKVRRTRIMRTKKRRARNLFFR